ncbi:hypothetical protein QEG73_21425 [Chitinophagaceae bacterium 26-R-25]|nr:hypothetical protein [Chitinophagaceae bacterium 26-R-25]
MKTILLTTIVAATLLCSCAVHRFRSEEEEMLIENKAALFIKENGDTVKCKSLTLPSDMNAHVQWINVDGKKIDSKGIVAVQDGKRFYAKFNSPVGDYWARQIKRGKINLFCFDSKTANGYVTSFVIQKGNEPLGQVNIPGMAARLKDNKVAYEKFVSKFGDHERTFLPKDMNKHPKTVLEAVDIYNSGDVAYKATK